jgi:glucose-1-phosphate thymidylyltransferase
LKGLILCGGKGSRLRPLTFSRPKQLLPVMNKPILFYGIEAMIEAGIKEIGVVIAPAYRRVFDDILMRGTPWNISITLIEQPVARGLADAVHMAQPFIQNDSFLLYLGDNLIDGSLKPLVKQFESEKLDGLISVSHVENPQQFGVVQLDGEKIIKLIEKPKNPPSHLAINGAYLFRPLIFDAISKIRPSWRDEYEITDAIQQMIDDGYEVGVFRSPYWWKDTGQPKDLIFCNQYFLQKLNGIQFKGTTDQHSTITGSVDIGENVKIINSVIRGPVIIEKNSVIESSYIGPYSSISSNVFIKNCELENSIILENTSIENIPYRIDESLIGGEVKMLGVSQQPHCIRLWIGDSSQLYFPW